jgi:hypothetical protein
MGSWCLVRRFAGFSPSTATFGGLRTEYEEPGTFQERGTQAPGTIELFKSLIAQREPAWASAQGRRTAIHPDRETGSSW